MASQACGSRNSKDKHSIVSGTINLVKSVFCKCDVLSTSVDQTILPSSKIISRPVDNECSKLKGERNGTLAVQYVDHVLVFRATASSVYVTMKTFSI